MVIVLAEFATKRELVMVGLATVVEVGEAAT